MTVDVYIDRLVLEGLSARDGRRIAAALQHQLGQLIASQGLTVAADAAVERRDTGTVKTTDAGRPRQIGVHLAQAVFREASR
jgi:predicted HD phosphohydrolase